MCAKFRENQTDQNGKKVDDTHTDIRTESNTVKLRWLQAAAELNMKQSAATMYDSCWHDRHYCHTHAYCNTVRVRITGTHLRGVYSDTTQLNSTSSNRHVHSVNNCHRSVLNVMTQLTQFVGHDVIYDVF